MNGVQQSAWFLDGRTLTCLTLQDQDEIAEIESSEWISHVDRGGVVHVNDECFQLFLSMECAIRRHLENTKDRKGDEIFKNMENILSCDDVLFDWLMITGDEEEHKELLTHITKQWGTFTCKVCLRTI